ncbi:MAG: glycosyltransferase family 4 protein [Sphingomonadales bacterium]|nr:glycosyltransferase family 4 protein [Sphingomonadales bacterium]MDE2568525.1 glycosyltransferase family 4 protein [Sphingomonadales bacterium]
MPNRATPLRILHLHSTFGTGGKEARAVALMNAFGKGLRHAIVSAEPGATGASAAIDASVEYGFPFGFPPLAGKFSMQRLRKLARAMKDFDLVLTYNWGAMDAAMAHALFAPSMRLPPLVHHEDGFNADEAMRLKPTRNWYRMVALSRASAVVVPSRRLEQVALGTWRQPREKVVRIANGVDTAAYVAAPRPDVLPRVVKHKDEYWVGTMAGLRPVKNLPRLVRAFAPLDELWQLVILGEGPERDAIHAEALRLGVAHRVHMPGHFARPWDAAGLFDIFALSSDSEQFPLSVIEAMAAGVPVAAPAVGDVAEIVAAENAPYIVEAGDEAALSGSLAALAASHSLRRAVGAANRDKARADFDRAGMVAAYARLYARVMGREGFP